MLDAPTLLGLSHPIKMNRLGFSDESAFAAALYKCAFFRGVPAFEIVPAIVKKDMVRPERFELPT
jgi:hypothetical protein